MTLLIESIRRDPGFMELRPIITDETGLILAGHQRAEAIRRLGKVEIPDSWIRVAHGLTTEQKRRFLVIDNAPEGMSGQWDLCQLTNVFESHELMDFGFDLKDIQKQIEDLKISDQVQFVGAGDIIDPPDRVRLRSIPAFMGAYCLEQATPENFYPMKRWKNDPDAHKVFEAALVDRFVTAIESRRNIFDMLTVPPPNARRDGYRDYPIWHVAQAVANRIDVKCVQVFKSRANPTRHGRGARMHQEQERLLILEDVTGPGSVLLLDDVCTTRHTIRACQSALAERGLACFAVVYFYWGNI